MGGSALAPDTTKAATRDCAAALRARMSHCVEPVEAGTVPKRVQMPSVADCRDTTVQARVRTETSRCGAMSGGVSPDECWSPGCPATWKEHGARGAQSSGSRGV